MKTHKVTIDKGCPNQEQIKISGEGHQVPEGTGDLILAVNTEVHDCFTRKGADLYLTHKITLLQALTGVNFTMKHLDDRIVRIQNEPGNCIHPD